ncbi:transcriptional protein SWT1 isoform X1 [Labrus bergylta]|uniref:transcriptional protein SWT1 isoform X1 n=2 Tax=Labrus bergylta TaxID=56723 RepID=UPI003313CB2B
MSKKSKKRKCKRLSSSSSEEDEKKSKKRDATRDYSRAEKKHRVKTQESSAEKRERSASAAVKDVSQSTRLIKKPVFRLRETHATDKKPANKEEEHRKTKRVTVSPHREHRSSKAKHETSGKVKTASGSKTVDRGTAKPLNTNKADAAPQRAEKTSEGSPDETSSQRSKDKLKKELTSPSSVSDEHKKHVKYALKRKHTAEEPPPRTADDGNSIKEGEPNKSSHTSSGCENQKKMELFEEMCQRHSEKKLKAKTSLCAAAKPSSASTKEPSSTSADHTTSVSSSKVGGNAASIKGTFTTVSFQKVEPSSIQQQKSTLALLKFKIPKKVQPRPAHSTVDNNVTSPTDKNIKNVSEPLNSEASVSKPEQETTVRETAPSRVTVTPSVSSEGQDKRPSSSGQPPATFDTVTEPWCNQVAEELHLARSEKRLEVNVMQSYGELTCMEIDPPEEVAESHCKQPLQQDLFLVLDTNILISHLDYVKKIRSHGLEALGFPVVLIPWVVLQELDSLKRGNGLSGSVAHRATPAISYICNSLKSREPGLWGQSMQQAAASSNDLNAENNDDRVLQCCLQYQTLYPECALILCTNDKNLCSKAILSGVKALSKTDLEQEVVRTRHGFNPLQNIKTSSLPRISPQVSSTILNRSFTVQPPGRERAELSVELVEKDYKEEQDKERAEWGPTCVSALEDCLRAVLSEVLEVEMKAAFDDIWLEIVYVKPPWTLQDVLLCLKKHWIAVFGQIVSRRLLQTVQNLINFFKSGITVNCTATKAALQEAKELVKAFGKSSNRVPGAISELDNLFNKLQPQISEKQIYSGESPAEDVVMNDDDEEKQPTPAQVSHQEVWALFESIWDKVFQTSLEVFKALGFDPQTMQRAQQAGGPPPPQDALVCLHKLSSVVSQLLQGFSSILSSEEALTLLSIIHSIEIVEVDCSLTAQHLHDCFSQQDYRDKLRTGGNLLMELKGALDQCVWTFTSRS